MGQLFLVRHAQASFLEPDYDKLSALGEHQARLLGKYLAMRRIIFERACTGPRVRQKDTAKLVGEVYRNEGAPFPALRVLPEFDEYHGEAVLEKSLPGLLETDPRIRGLHAAHHASGDSAGRHATFQRLFEAVISKWACGLICPQGVEPWSDFCSRVNSGLMAFLSAGGRGERVAIFTSGGPVAVAMQRALLLSTESTLQVSWMSRNSSWSEFLHSDNRFTLSSFNAHGHIDDPTMLTYR
jgi:broad specificity phosphatase PhoE